MHKAQIFPVYLYGHIGRPQDKAKNSKVVGIVCKHCTKNLISSTACIKGYLKIHASKQFEGTIPITEKEVIMIFLLNENRISLA